MSHRIVHWEIMGPDGDAVRDFYEGLFGWKTEPVEGFDSYHLVGDDDTTIGGALGKGPEEMSNYVMLYIEVDDVDEHLAKAESAGGSTIMPKTVIPDIVTFGMFSDPAGNVLGIVERDTPES